MASGPPSIVEGVLSPTTQNDNPKTKKNFRSPRNLEVKIEAGIPDAPQMNGSVSLFLVLFFF